MHDFLCYINILIYFLISDKCVTSEGYFFLFKPVQGQFLKNRICWLKN